jgi:hypothetical protein
MTLAGAILAPEIVCDLPEAHSAPVMPQPILLRARYPIDLLQRPAGLSPARFD